MNEAPGLLLPGTFGGPLYGAKNIFGIVVSSSCGQGVKKDQDSLNGSCKVLKLDMGFVPVIFVPNHSNT